MMNGAFPDVVVKEEDLIASGDRVVERSSAVATHKGAMMGEQPTNKRVAWSEIPSIACKMERSKSTRRKSP
jgi:predicted ester cyclase